MDNNKRNILAIIAVAVILLIGLTVRISFSASIRDRIMELVKMPEQIFQFDWKNSELLHWGKKEEETEASTAVTEATEEPALPTETTAETEAATVPTEPLPTEPILPPIENSVEVEEEENIETESKLELPWDTLISEQGDGNG